MVFVKKSQFVVILIVFACLIFLGSVFHISSNLNGEGSNSILFSKQSSEGSVTSTLRGNAMLLPREHSDSHDHEGILEEFVPRTENELKNTAEKGIPATVDEVNSPLINSTFEVIKNNKNNENNSQGDKEDADKPFEAAPVVSAIESTDKEKSNNVSEDVYISAKLPYKYTRSKRVPFSTDYSHSHSDVNVVQKLQKPPPLDVHIIHDGHVSEHVEDLFYSLLPTSLTYGEEQHCVSVKPVTAIVGSGNKVDPLGEIKAGGSESSDVGLGAVKAVRMSLNEGQSFNESYNVGSASPLLQSLQGLADIISNQLLESHSDNSLFIELSSYSISAATISHSIASAHPKITSVLVHSAVDSGKTSGASDDPSAMQVEGLEDIADHVLCSISQDSNSIEHDVSVVVRPDPLNLYIIQDNNALLTGITGGAKTEIPTKHSGSSSSSSSENVGPVPLELNCVQYIDDLEELVGGLLPFEFESLLQKILCRCSVTYLPVSLPSGESSYFNYWESMAELVDHVNLTPKDASGSTLSCLLSYNESSSMNRVIHKAKLNGFGVIERVISKTIAGDISVGQLVAASPITSHYHKIISMISTHPTAADIPLHYLMKSQRDLEAAVDAAFRISGAGSDAIDHEYNSRVRQRQKIDEYNQKRNSIIRGMKQLTSPMLEVAASWLDSFVVRGSAVEWIASSDHWSQLTTDNVIHELHGGRKLLSYGNTKLLTSSSRSASHNSRYSSGGSKVGSSSGKSGNVDEIFDLSDIHTSRRKVHKSLLEKAPSRVHWDIVPGTLAGGADQNNNKYIAENNNPDDNYWLEWPSFESIDGYMEQKGKYATSNHESNNGMSLDLRMQQQLLQSKESHSYTRWMKLFRKTHFSNSSGHDSKHMDSIFPMNELRHAKLIYVGGNHASMLSIKLSKMLQSQQNNEFEADTGADIPSLGVVVSIVQDPSSIQPHETMLELMGIPNNIVCSSVVQMSQLAALASAPERASIAIYQVDITLRIFTIAWLTASSVVSVPPTLVSKSHEAGTGDGKVSMDSEICLYMHSLLEKMFAILISTADITYIEMPTAERLMSVLSAIEAVSTLSAKTTRTSTNRNMVRLMLSMQCGKGYFDHAEDASTLDSSFNLHVIEKSIQRLGYTLKDKVAVKLNYRVTELRHDADESSLTVYRVANYGSPARVPDIAPKLSDKGVSLYSLLHLGVVNSHKKKLLKMLIDFPTWSGETAKDVVHGALDDIMPWNLFVEIASTGVKIKSAASDIAKAARAYSASGGKATAGGIISDSFTLKYNLRLHLMSDSTSSSKAGPGVVLDGHSGGGESKISLKTEQLEANLVYSMIMNEFNTHPGELASGKFSCVEHASGNGFLSMQIANRFPNATMFSLEEDPLKVSRHEFMADQLDIRNNYIARTSPAGRSKILYNLYDSPELFRFQIINDGLYSHGESSLLSGDVEVGITLSIALTSFIKVPSSKQVSWAMNIMHKTGYIAGAGHHDSHSVSLIRNMYQKVTMLPIRRAHSNDDYSLKSHPMKEYDDFESYWLLGSAKLPQSSVRTDKDSSVAWLGDSNTKVSITPLFLNGRRVPWVRSDIVNMTRHVHHHYDYSRDGHARTYTMRISVNETFTDDIGTILDESKLEVDASHMVGVQDDKGILLYPSWSVQGESHRKYRTVYSPVLQEILDDVSDDEKHRAEAANAEALRSYLHSKDDASLPILLPAGHHANQHKITSVHLYRDRDGFPIPYVSVYGITLITALRLGIIEKQLNNLYNSFLKLPLFEDMAPWNIVLMGKSVDYIDYDTKDMFYDLDIPKAYQIMTVLMNYKRTVEDFKHCGTKSNTVYGLPYVSDCVGSTVGHSDISKTMPKSCPDLKLPVPCGDGECHSDYISCLRSFAEISSEYSLKTMTNSPSSGEGSKTKKQSIADSIKGGMAAFNEKGLY